jgi:hypothetical protein
MILALLLSVLVPDTSAILRLSSGKSTIGHACPLGPLDAMTNRHIVDGETGFQWSDAEGVHRGYAKPIGEGTYADLGWLRADEDTPFPRWFELSKVMPKVGDAVFLIGYSFDNRKKAFAERVFETRILRLVAGLIILEQPGVPGSSGSCLLAADGTVIGINAGAKGLGDEGKQGAVGIAVGLWRHFDAEKAKENK